MTYQNLTTETQTSPEAVTYWMRGEPREGEARCICCPEQPSHVFAYGMRLVDPDSANPRYQTTDLANQQSGHLDYGTFINDAIAKMPEGTRFRIVVEPITEES